MNESIPATADRFEITEKKFLHDYHTAFYKLLRLPLDWVNADSKNYTICGREHCNALCARIMEDPIGSERCAANDRALIQEGKRRREPVIHKCHAGFYDALIPVFSNDRYVGALCIGQFLHRNPRKKELAELRRSLNFLHFAPGELENYYKQTPKLSQEQSEGLMELIQVLGEHITEFYQHIRFWDSVKGSDGITLAQRYIRQHYKQPLTISGIARAVGMSQSHFLHKFTSQMGVSPYVYLNNYRVEQAAELMKNSKRNIFEIAEICGFRNIYTMNRYFKKTYGCTPTEFRQSNSL